MTGNTARVTTNNLSDHELPIPIGSSESLDDDVSPKRTGKVLTGKDVELGFISKMTENTARVTTNNLSDHELPIPIGNSESLDDDVSPKRTGKVLTGKDVELGFISKMTENTPRVTTNNLSDQELPIPIGSSESLDDDVSPERTGKVLTGKDVELGFISKMTENTARVTTNNLSDHELPIPISSSENLDDDVSPKRTGKVLTGKDVELGFISKMTENTARVTTNNLSDHELPIPIGSSESLDDDVSPKRTGKVLTGKDVELGFISKMTENTARVTTNNLFDHELPIPIGSSEILDDDVSPKRTGKVLTGKDVELGFISKMTENTAQVTTNNLSDHELPIPKGSSESVDDDVSPKRTGTVWTASAYIVTAVTGPVFLNIAWDMAQLGWIAGPFLIILFSFVTYFASMILCDSYISHDKRNPTYMDAIRSNIDGPIVLKICGVLQYLGLFEVTSRYTVSAATGMADINWYAKCHRIIHQEEPCCVYRNETCYDWPCNAYLKPHFIAFGVFQIFLSQIPNFHQLRWLTVLCLVMFLLYSSIGLGLAIAKVAELLENGKIRGSLTGMGIGPYVTRAQKTWMILTAIGDIAQAYDFSNVLLEIQDTVGPTVGHGSQPSEVQTMKKATRRSVVVITFISMIHGCMGYAAFGECSPTFLPDGFLKPYWLLHIGSAALVIQTAGGYQIFVQPIFARVEKSILRIFQHNAFIKKEIKIWGPYKLKLFRLIWRTFFVTVITLLSMFFAVFLDVLKLVQIMAFWAIVIYFPVRMHIVQNGILKWSARWLRLQILSFGCFIVTIAAAAANVADTFLGGSYKPFKPNRYSD